MKNSFLTISLATLFLLSISVSAQASRFSPATFKTGDSAFSSQIKFPRSFPDGKHVFLCTAIANYMGGLSAVSCSISAERKKHEKKAIRAIQKASHHVRVFPATIEGAGKKVWFNFSVTFNKKGGQQEITTSENHLLNSQKYGESYTAAQRLIKPTTKMCAKGITLSINIDENGKASNSNIISSRRTEVKSCNNRMLKLMMESEYIPGTVNQAPVPTNYQEAFTKLNKLYQ